MSLKRFDHLVSELRRTLGRLPDKRQGTNKGVSPPIASFVLLL